MLITSSSGLPIGRHNEANRSLKPSDATNFAMALASAFCEQKASSLVNRHEGSQQHSVLDQGVVAHPDFHVQRRIQVDVGIHQLPRPWLQSSRQGRLGSDVSIAVLKIANPLHLIWPRWLQRIYTLCQYIRYTLALFFSNAAWGRSVRQNANAVARASHNMHQYTKT